MTFVEHGLIGGAIAYKASPDLFWLGVAAGIAPDILPMSLALYKTGVRNVAKRVKSGQTEDLPVVVYKTYDITHSLITTAILFLVLLLINKNLVVLAVVYGVHILCDIPFHDNRFATRFLSPLSRFHIRGYAQGKHRWVHAVNLFIIIAIYAFWVI